MPVMDGRAFIQKARNEMKTHIPIVVLTSVDRDEATRDLIESGASAILYKPATVVEIVSTLQQVC
jgi:CheY-like chemotaxis protein